MITHGAIDYLYAIGVVVPMARRLALSNKH